jgi:hypothetical protein
MKALGLDPEGLAVKPGAGAAVGPTGELK